MYDMLNCTAMFSLVVIKYMNVNSNLLLSRTLISRIIALNETMASIAHETHEILGKVFILAVTLHIAGALKHHLLDKDGTLGRMLGKKIGQPN